MQVKSQSPGIGKQVTTSTPVTLNIKCPQPDRNWRVNGKHESDRTIRRIRGSMTTVAKAPEDGCAEPSTKAASPVASPPEALPQSSSAWRRRHVPRLGRPSRPEADAEPRVSDAAALPQVLKILGSVVAPTTLLTALMYYFGRQAYAGLLWYFGVGRHRAGSDVARLSEQQCGRLHPSIDRRRGGYATRALDSPVTDGSVAYSDPPDRIASADTDRGYCRDNSGESGDGPTSSRIRCFPLHSPKAVGSVSRSASCC